jgi:peptidoglycan/xylan/chitin deacetylase (PgdA/CDA1 family)
MSCVVYTCHHVAVLAPGQEERGTIDIRAFLHQLQWLDRLGIRFIPMKDLRAWLTGKKTMPRRAAVMTFDDAYASVYDHAFPVLKQRAIPFTVFVIAGLIGKKSNFYAHRGGQKRRHMDCGQLKSLIESGWGEVGAHGYHHLDLTRASGDSLAKELVLAKDLLEESLEVEVPYFAYPYGNTTGAIKQKVRKAGYQLAFTTRKMKLTSANVDLLAIPRVNWSRGANLFKLYKYYLLPWIRSAG